MSANRYRHVVFTASPPRRPLNLGPASGALLSDATVAAATARPTTLAPNDEQDHAGARDDHQSFFAWVFLEAGLSVRHYQIASLRRRLPACLRALRVENVIQARRLLRRHPQFIPAAVDALLLGVTEFFRDAPVFETIERELPSLLAAADADGSRPLRIWSAGCSDGAELYSVAMLLAQMGALQRCELLGTDCRDEALSAAADGAFSANALRGLPPAMLRRHFPTGTEPDARPGATPSRRVDVRLRDVVRWRKADLLAGPQPGPWDLVLCRNMAMYLRPVAAERLWRGLISSLRPGALLVLGKAERPSAAAMLGLSPVAPCVYRRRYGVL